MTREDELREEAATFDAQTADRIAQGLVPDLERLARVSWLYNNVWREPELVRLRLVPKIRFVLDAVAPRGGNALEIGCGPGYLTLELARAGLHTIGLDLSPTSIEAARRFAAEAPMPPHAGDVTYVCSDLEDYDLGQERFDAIVFFGTLHHFNPIDGLLDRVARALRPGGNLVVCEPVRDNFTRRSAELAALLRAVLPTWRDVAEKLDPLRDARAWEAYVAEIFDEYTYQGTHRQSPCDNATVNEARLVGAIERRFQIVATRRADAFVDKLLGGLRGPDGLRLARFLSFLDDLWIEQGVLPATHLSLHAVRTPDFGPSP